MIVGVLFTCFHALIQAYVFAILSSLFVGEAAVPSVKKAKMNKESDEPNLAAKE